MKDLHKLAFVKTTRGTTVKSENVRFFPHACFALAGREYEVTLPLTKYARIIEGKIDDFL
jgi:hypothetical protein